MSATDSPSAAGNPARFKVAPADQAFIAEAAAHISRWLRDKVENSMHEIDVGSIELEELADVADAIKACAVNDSTETAHTLLRARCTDCGGLAIGGLGIDIHDDGPQCWPCLRRADAAKDVAAAADKNRRRQDGTANTTPSDSAADIGLGMLTTLGNAMLEAGIAHQKRRPDAA